MKNKKIFFLLEQDNIHYHDASYYDEKGKKINKQKQFIKYAVDDELTIYYTKNVDINNIKAFLKDFKAARKKVEQRFKMKLGTAYKSLDASYFVEFGKHIVFDDDESYEHVAEYVRGQSQHSPENSFYFNLPKINDFYEDAKKNWIQVPSYQNLRSYNISKIEDIVIHEIAHALYFQQPLEKRKLWKKYYDNGGWQNASSLYGQESDAELFAETVVDLINNEKSKIIDDLVFIFEF
jgi:hypothetical protein